MDCGALGNLEFTALADCYYDKLDAISKNFKISVYLPSDGSRPGHHFDVSNIISEGDLENIGHKLIDAFEIRFKDKPFDYLNFR